MNQDFAAKAQTRRFQREALALFTALAALVIGLSIAASGGKLIYFLDDPYIHLAVAENILRGGYGVNLGELSSPSSSVLYPYLLAALLWLGIGEAAPLVVNFIASAAALWVMTGFVWRYSGHKLPGAARLWVRMLAALTLVLATNAPAIMMMGMEHPLHALAAVWTIAGLARLFDSGRLTPMLVAGIILGPLIRFEGMALTLTALVVLGLYGRIRAALACAAILAAILSAYAAYMAAMGLPLLPSSVMVKSGAFGDRADGAVLAALYSVLVNLMISLIFPMGLLFLIAAGAMLRRAFRQVLSRTASLRSPAVLMALTGAATLLAHAGFSRYLRYEEYAVFVMLMTVSYLFAQIAPNLVAALAGLWRGGRKPAALLPVWGLLAVFIYALMTIATPLGARNIYQQQYQMHRFATGYFAHVVAVNDLGWVAYGNDNHVVDLWGLGSEDIRRKTAASGYSAALLSEVTAGHGAVYAMLYESWFGAAIPPRWCRMAVLSTPAISAAEGEVAFFLIEPAQEAAMRAALVAFAPTLPAGASLQIAKSCR